MTVIIHVMGGVVQGVYAESEIGLLMCADLFYPGGLSDDATNRCKLITDLESKGYHSHLDGEEGYSELVMREVEGA